MVGIARDLVDDHDTRPVSNYGRAQAPLLQNPSPQFPARRGIYGDGRCIRGTTEAKKHGGSFGKGFVRADVG